MTRDAIRHRPLRLLPALLALAALGSGPAAAEPVETRLFAGDAALGDRFGSAVAIAGGHAVIGAQADDDHGGDSGSVYVLDLATGVQLRKLNAADAAAGDFLGCAVAAHGGVAIAGALRDDHVATDAGSAYLFDLATGAQLHKLTASDAAQDDWFGKSVAIADGYALVGAYKSDQSASYYDTGSAYLFDVATGAELHALTASDAGRQDWYGYAVAVSQDYAAVGAPTWDGIGSTRSNCGAVYVYDVATGQELWKLTTADQGAEDRFGNALAISGDRLVVGAYWDHNAGGGAAGAAYVFDLTTGQQISELTAAPPEGGGDWLGSSVAIAGDLVLAGATQQGYGTELEGFACLFDLATGAEVMRFEASDGGLDDNFGVSAAFDGDRVLLGADMDDNGGINAGSVYRYMPIDVSTGSPPPSGALIGLALSNRPNPFNPSTEISLSLPVDATVTIGIYDLGGRIVRTLVAAARERAGEVRVRWDGTDGNGCLVPSGVYLCRARAGSAAAVAKLTLLE